MMLKTKLSTFLLLCWSISSSNFVTGSATDDHDHRLHQSSNRRNVIGHRFIGRHRSERIDNASERIRRAQVDPHAHHTTVLHKRGPSVLPTTTTTSATSTSVSANILLAGSQPATAQCTGVGTSDACTDSKYTVSASGVSLVLGTIPASGHINFQYIALSDYQGVGSYRNPPSNWKLLSGGLNFDPNNNQPGGAYIGSTFFPFSAGANLPASGYCIVWVQVGQFNEHYGEGGQGPVCSGPITLSSAPTSTSTTSSSSSPPTSATSQTSARTSTSTSSAPTTSSSSSSFSSTTSSATISANTATQTLYGQCGGNGYTGPSRCITGSTCTYQNDWWSACQPDASKQCVALWAQCGGDGYTGATCCTNGSCKYSNQWYSQCQL